MPSPRKLRILLTNENTSILTLKNGVTKQARDKLGPKRCYAANTKHHTSIDNVRKAIYPTQRYRNDPLNNVVNLSKKTFTYNEFKLLHKDLNFCPTPGKYNTLKHISKQHNHSQRKT